MLNSKTKAKSMKFAFKVWLPIFLFAAGLGLYLLDKSSSMTVSVSLTPLIIAY